MKLFAFPKSKRLLSSSEYKKVSGKAKKLHSGSFLFLYSPNEYSHARLGITVSKKCSKLAVKRNRLKRIIRESFRHMNGTLPNIDIIVIGKRSAITQDNATLLSTLDTLWKRLIEQ